MALPTILAGLFRMPTELRLMVIHEIMDLTEIDDFLRKIAQGMHPLQTSADPSSPFQASAELSYFSSQASANDSSSSTTDVAIRRGFLDMHNKCLKQMTICSNALSESTDYLSLDMQNAWTEEIIYTIDQWHTALKKRFDEYWRLRRMQATP